MNDWNAVRELSAEDCWTLLAEARLGRLAVSVGDEVDIFPVNFVVSDGALYFRTSPGDKLLEVSVNPNVAFEIDRVDERTAASVVVHGTAERLERQSEIDAADRLPLTPWIPTLKYRWVRIVPTRLSGRAFDLGPEPERY